MSAVRKVVIHRPGGVEQLALESHPEPVAAPGEVVIDVRSIGVNYADCVVRMGLYRSAKEYVGWPITPGFEVTGVVRALGHGVTDLEVGQPVLGVTRFGGYSTQVVVPRHQVFAVPGGVSLQDAAGIPVVFLTAHYALLELAAARPGARVLIHSAAGGVGLAAVQIAVALGCRVVGVVGRSEKVDLVQRYGAHAVIDKSQTPLWPAAQGHAPTGYDVILDANGVSTLRQSFDHLAATGRLIIYGFHSMLPRGTQLRNWLSLGWHFVRTPRFSPFDLTDKNRSVMGFNLSYLFDHTDALARGMADIARWFSEGEVRVLPTLAYPLARVGDAHAALQSGTTVGKLVLVPEYAS